MPNSPARENVGQLIPQIARQWRRRLDLRLRPFGLTEATWLPLLYLSRAKTTMRQKDLAAALTLDNSSVVRLLDALQAGGLIERRDEISDRRVKTIHLTEAAHDVIEQVEAASRAVRDELLQGIDDEALKTTFDVLTQIFERLAEPGSDTDD